MPDILEDLNVLLNFNSKTWKKSLSHVQGFCRGKKYTTNFLIVSRLQQIS